MAAKKTDADPVLQSLALLGLLRPEMTKDDVISLAMEMNHVHFLPDPEHGARVGDSKLTFQRQPDGTYSKLGELPAGTEYVTLEYQTRPNGNGAIRPLSEAIQIIDKLILNGRADGCALEEWYSIVPVKYKGDYSTQRLNAIKAMTKAERLAIRDKLLGVVVFPVAPVAAEPVSVEEEQP